MPATWSVIRTVPGGKVLVGWLVGSATRASPPGSEPLRPRPIATTSSTRTTPSTPSPMSSGRRRDRRGRTGSPVPVSAAPPDSPAHRGGGAPQDSQPDGGSGARGAGDSNERPTLTPGPAGVVTSDQAEPFHQRTVPGAPSGSGYQPGTGAPG